MQIDISPDNLSLKFVKDYLRVEHDFDDKEIQLMILSAQSYVRNYIRATPDQTLDMELTLPMLSIIAYCYENKTIAMKANEKADLMFDSILNMHRSNIL